MKVAICLSGQSRTIGRTWPSLCENLVSRFDCDVFIHSSTEYVVPGEFWDLIQPDAYRIEKQYPFPFESDIVPFYFHPPILNDYLQQVNGYKRVWELKDGNYDLVIRTRPDIEYLKPIDLGMFDPDKINLVPRILDPDRNQCSTDPFFVGSEAVMRPIMNIIDWLPTAKLNINDPWTSRLPKENAEHVAGRHSPESLLMTCIEAHGVPFRYTDFCFENMLRVLR